jgi:site-specific DNA-adenine methylase
MDPKQEDINNYLIEEIKKLQISQEKLKDEVQELKNQNTNLMERLQVLKENQMLSWEDEFKEQHQYDSQLNSYFLNSTMFPQRFSF